MEKPQRMPQIYGYLVCLVAVIPLLICASTLIYAISDLGDPIHAGFNPAGTPSLAVWLNNGLGINFKDAITAGKNVGACLPVDENSIQAAITAMTSALTTFPNAQ